jgi:hypothetical protein
VSFITAVVSADCNLALGCAGYKFCGFISAYRKSCVRWWSWQCTWQGVWKCGPGVWFLGCFEDYHTMAKTVIWYMGEDYTYIMQKTSLNNIYIVFHYI